jgi:hypothetical protein
VLHPHRERADPRDPEQRLGLRLGLDHPYVDRISLLFKPRPPQFPERLPLSLARGLPLALRMLVCGQHHRVGPPTAHFLKAKRLYRKNPIVTPVSRVSEVDTYTGLTSCLCLPVYGFRGVTRLIA